MPVQTLHAEYSANAGTWKRMRTIAAGQEAVHGAREVMLPRLTAETDEDYFARIARSGFYNATGRTIEGLVGMLFRKDPEIKVSAASEKMLEDVTKDGTPIAAFMQATGEEQTTVARVGVMVDYPPVATEGMTVAAAESLNLRPHMAMYATEAIINWDYSWINNRTMLSLVVLAEDYAETDPTDEFARIPRKRYRVLDLVPGKDAGDVGHVYRQRVFLENAPAGTAPEEIFPRMAGKKLGYIPFELFGASKLGAGVERPPLLDLANVNVSHYHTTADLEHGCHKTALPTPWIAGIQPIMDARGQPQPMTFYMGGGNAWAFPDKDTTCGMLEYTGAGLTSLETRLEKKEAQMAVLGARMLEQQKSGVESAETAGIHRSSEQSTLQTQGATLSRGFKNVLSWFDQWAGGTGVVECKVNDDFLPANMDPATLTALVQAWQQGALSKEALFEKLQKGGVISDARDFETEEHKIDNAPPTLLAQSAAAPEPDPADDSKGDPKA